MDLEPLFFNLRTLILEGFMSELTDFEQEVAEMLVESLNLPIKPEAIKAEEPLFNAGLGLDSIDALELALAISQKYGVQIRSDDENVNQFFSSLRALSEYIHNKRKT